MNRLTNLLTLLCTWALLLTSVSAQGGKRKDNAELDRVHASIVGEWHVRPTGAEPWMTAMRLIVRDPPPTEAELDAVGLDPESLVELKAAALPLPSDSLRESALSMLAASDEVRIVVTPARLSLRSPGAEAQEMTYTVQIAAEGAENRLHLVVTRASGELETSAWVLDDAQVMVLQDDEVRFRLERVSEVTP
ncbi:MAG: hypothetical protein ACI9MC_001261 [Kiritimatiellia bacterium]